MVKGFFFENNGGTLHKCMFAGLDKENHAHWLMADQGEPSMTLREYMDMELMEDGDVRLLCMEGETVEPTTMALLLGAVLHGYPSDTEEALNGALRTLRNKSVSWSERLLQISVYMRRYYDKDVASDRYRFYAYCREYGFLFELDDFKSVKELMGVLRCYFDALEYDAGMVLLKSLHADEEELKSMDQKDLLMFDEK